MRADDKSDSSGAFAWIAEPRAVTRGFAVSGQLSGFVHLKPVGFCTSLPEEPFHPVPLALREVGKLREIPVGAVGVDAETIRLAGGETHLLLISADIETISSSARRAPASWICPERNPFTL